MDSQPSGLEAVLARQASIGTDFVLVGARPPRSAGGEGRPPSSVALTPGTDRPRSVSTGLAPTPPTLTPTLRKPTLLHMPSRKRTTVYLDARLHRALRLRSKATDCTISEVIGDALRQALAEEARNLQTAELRKPERRMSLNAVGARLKGRARS
jgi:hypothetical protein